MGITNYADNFLGPYPVLNYFWYPPIGQGQLKLSSVISRMIECDSAAKTILPCVKVPLDGSEHVKGLVLEFGGGQISLPLVISNYKESSNSYFDERARISSVYSF